MVKIPGLDDLKKMGSDLIDSAKTVNIGGMVDKLKTGVESISKKSGADILSGDDPLGQLLQGANMALTELAAANAAQANLIKKLQNQVADIARVAAAYQKPATPAQPTVPAAQQKDDPK